MTGDGVKIVDGQSFKTAFYKNYVLTTTSPDCYIMSITKQFYEIQDIVNTENSGTKLICKQFDRTDYAFYVPTDEDRFESSRIGIHLLKRRCETLEIIDIEDFATKCVIRINEERSTFCYPMIAFR